MITSQQLAVGSHLRKKMVVKKLLSRFWCYVRCEEPIERWHELLKRRKIYDLNSSRTDLSPKMFRLAVPFVFCVKCLVALFIDQEDRLQAMLAGEIHHTMGIAGRAGNLIDAFANFEVGLMRVLHVWLEMKKMDPLEDQLDYFPPEKSAQLKRKLMMNLAATKALATYLSVAASSFYVLLTIYDVSVARSTLESLGWLVWGCVFVYICLTCTYDMGVFWGLLMAQLTILRAYLSQVKDEADGCITSSSGPAVAHRLSRVRAMYLFCCIKFAKMNAICQFMLFILCQISIPLNTLVILNGIKEKGVLQILLIPIGSILALRVYYTQKQAYHLDSKNQVIYKLFHSILAKNSRCHSHGELVPFFQGQLDHLQARPGPFTTYSWGGSPIDGIFMIHFYTSACSLFLLLVSFYDL